MSSFRQALITGTATILGLTTLTTVILRAGGETPAASSAEWRAASAEYMRFQQMNPIGLGGRKPYSPEYLEKEN